MVKRGRVFGRAVIGFIGLASLASFGCGGPEAKSPRKHVAAVNPFPSRDALAKLAEAPVATLPVRNVASSPEWNVEIVPSDAPSPAETRFAQVATKADAKMMFSKELRCVARELGRFQLDHGAPPNERLKRFMIAACGVTTPGVGAFSQTGDAGSESDEQLLATWQKTLAIPRELQGTAAGVWMTRKNKRVVIMTAFVKPQADLSVSPVDAAGAFTVQGSAAASMCSV